MAIDVILRVSCRPIKSFTERTCHTNAWRLTVEDGSDETGTSHCIYKSMMVYNMNVIMMIANSPLTPKNNSRNIRKAIVMIFPTGVLSAEKDFTTDLDLNDTETKNINKTMINWWYNDLLWHCNCALCIYLFVFIFQHLLFKTWLFYELSESYCDKYNYTNSP